MDIGATGAEFLEVKGPETPRSAGGTDLVQVHDLSSEFFKRPSLRTSGCSPAAPCFDLLPAPNRADPLIVPKSAVLVKQLSDDGRNEHARACTAPPRGNLVVPIGVEPHLLWGGGAGDRRCA